MNKEILSPVISRCGGSQVCWWIFPNKERQCLCSPDPTSSNFNGFRLLSLSLSAAQVWLLARWAGCGCARVTDPGPAPACVRDSRSPPAPHSPPPTISDSIKLGRFSTALYLTSLAIWWWWYRCRYHQHLPTNDIVTTNVWSRREAEVSSIGCYSRLTGSEAASED